MKLDQPDWGPGSNAIAFGAELPNQGLRLHLILNAYWERLCFELPSPTNGTVWRRWIDTALDPPDEIVDWQLSPPVFDPAYNTGPRSVVVLFAGLDGDAC
jgi:glycogen operon protein